MFSIIILIQFEKKLNQKWGSQIKNYTEHLYGENVTSFFITPTD